MKFCTLNTALPVATTAAAKFLALMWTAIGGRERRNANRVRRVVMMLYASRAMISEGGSQRDRHS
jgi:hypothetical protein